ncbi:hypothetical protein SK137_0015 [Streptococcus mitis]|nr:hypothetical protein SK137_0015 [Streptococcus mitis]
MADGSLWLLGKGFVPKKLQPGLANLVFAGFSVFFNSKNAILTRWFS